MATARITPDELEELRRAGRQPSTTPMTSSPANRRFHRALNLAARSPRLFTYLRQAVRVVPGNYFELFPEQEQRSRREHAALLDAMERGDGAAGPGHRRGARAGGRRSAGRMVGRAGPGPGRALPS